jgi:hypothetical protein
VASLITRTRRALDTLPWQLLLVPVFVSVLQLDHIRAIARFEGFHLGLRPSLPAAIVDLWSFVNVPESTYQTPARSTSGTLTRYVEFPVPVSGLLGSSSATAMTLLLVVLVITVWTVIRSVLAAGYLGSLQEYRTTGTYSFGGNAVAYLRPFLALNLATTAAFLAGGMLLIAAPPLFILGLLLYLVGAFLFYGAPFLFVVEDCGFVAGLEQSYELALNDRAYRSWGVSYFGFTFVCSLLSSLVVIPLGLFGVLVGLAVLPALGMALTMATLSVFEDEIGTSTETAMPGSTGQRSLDSS